MYTRTLTEKFTQDYWDKISLLKEKLSQADCVIIGAGAGLSTSAGLTYGGKRFMDNFSDFYHKYAFRDMYSGGFYPFDTPEEHWCYWSRFIYINRYNRDVGQPYRDLLKLVNDRDYFVLTTNVDHCFQDTGFQKERLFYTQGDYGLWQCSKPCHSRTYDNEAAVRAMIEKQKDMRIPTELIPHCPVCGAPMSMNLRADATFVEDEGWHRARDRYHDFINRHRGKKILFLELGVGANTPGIIKYPFWQMTGDNPNATYCTINMGEAWAPREIRDRAVCIDGDIGEVLRKLSHGE